jgi:hypothetical protein
MNIGNILRLTRNQGSIPVTACSSMPLTQPGLFLFGKAEKIVMNVVYFGDIKTPPANDRFGMILVNFRTFANGGIHASYSK